MAKFFHAAAATLAIAITLASPAQAQLLRGGMGGGLGGGLGIGGGLPIGAAGAHGDFGVTGDVTRGVDGTTDSVRSSTHVTHSLRTTVKTPEVAVPPVHANMVAVPTVSAQTLRGATVPVGRAVTLVPTLPPAIPNVAIRRTAIIEAGIAPIAYVDVPAYVDQEYGVLQDELRGSGIRVERQGQQILLEMPSDVTFSFNKYNIQPRFYGVLNAVSHTLAKYPATYIDVNGHTDAVGSFSYNQVLSEKRADSVADYLATRQVNPARMSVQGFGKTEPIASNATITGRAANRRVEIVLTPYAS